MTSFRAQELPRDNLLYGWSQRVGRALWVNRRWDHQTQSQERVMDKEVGGRRQFCRERAKEEGDP